MGTGSRFARAGINKDMRADLTPYYRFRYGDDAETGEADYDREAA
jgi:hypothetical protein